jgi:hypothetical protein
MVPKRRGRPRPEGPDGATLSGDRREPLWWLRREGMGKAGQAGAGMSSVVTRVQMSTADCSVALGEEDRRVVAPV